MSYADAVAHRKKGVSQGRPGYGHDTVLVIVNATLQLDMVTPYVSPSPAGDRLGAALAASTKARADNAAKRELLKAARRLTSKPIGNIRDLLILGQCAQDGPAEARAEIASLLLSALATLRAAPFQEAE